MPTSAKIRDAVFYHMMVMAPEEYDVSQSFTHKMDRNVSDHRAVVLKLKGF